MSDEPRAEDREPMRAMLMRAGASAEQADHLIDAMGHYVCLMVHVLHHNRDVAPNHITIGYDAGGELYELTIRKHGGSTPADRIAELLSENERLRAELEGRR